MPVARDDSYTFHFFLPLSAFQANARKANAVVTDCRQFLPNKLTCVVFRLHGINGEMIANICFSV